VYNRALDEKNLFPRMVPARKGCNKLKTKRQETAMSSVAARLPSYIEKKNQDLNYYIRFLLALSGYSVRSLTAGMSGLIALTGPVFFVLTTAILESINIGYDRIHDEISALVWGQQGWCQTGVFYFMALALACLAWRLYQLNARKRTIKLGSVLLALTGMTFLVIAIFPTRAPGEAMSTLAMVHTQAARLLCTFFPIACLLFGVALRRHPVFNKTAEYSLIAGLVGLMLVLAGIFITIEQAPLIGILERLMLFNGIMWIEIMGISVFAAREKRSHPVATAVDA
jgi:hypothetical protein